MDYKTLHEKYTNCCQLVTTNKLHEAFSILEDLLNVAPNGELSNKLQEYSGIYNNILRYSFGAVEDPEKKAVYFRLLRSVIELADQVFESIIMAKHLLHYASLKREFADSLAYFPDETGNLIASVQNSEEKNNEDRDFRIKRLFTILWLTDKYRDSERDLVSNIIQSETLPWWDKSLLASAITLSLQRYFDVSKIQLLIEAYKKAEDQVWQRALVGLLFVFYQYRQRLFLYPKIKEQIESLHVGYDIEKHAETIIIQCIRSLDTEKIAKKFHDEILPEMSRIHTRIYDKMDLQNLIPDALQEDKNPDWEHVFHDAPGLLDKLEEMSMLQLDGSDVFMGTFSMLKQFPFFNEMTNWFKPFNKEEKDVRDLFISTENGLELGTSIEKSTIMCNSDKYSFCFNLQLVPERERKLMVEMFKMEAEAMTEINDDDKLLQKPNFERIVFSQYIQDLYRFYKLYFYRSEFFDFFSTSCDFYNTPFFSWIIKDASKVRNIGEFYFEKGYFEDAIMVFKQIDTIADNIELWQKIAYSYQKLGDYKMALEYYLRADLTDIKKPWNTKKIALCYNRLGNFSKALEYYFEAEKMEPENLHVQANIAHNYFDMKNYEEALKFYFKVEYLAPDNHKIQRPIAWCSLMLGKPETAKKYYEKVPESERTKHDLLNLGHAEWCLGNKQEAIENYTLSATKENSGFKWFADELLADTDILVQFGIDPIDIPLMRDYVQIAVGK